MDMEHKTSCDDIYMIINNIPKSFHASDLRNFFSSFVESGGFSCFHFRHRPEVQKSNPNGDSEESSNKSRCVTNCCIVKVKYNRAQEFLKSYNGEHWLDRKGNTLMTCCFIRKLVLSGDSNSTHKVIGPCKKGTVLTHLPLDRESFSHEDLDALIEMHPPSIMPNGNVGTKTSHFLDEIKACRLPPSLITKLGLQFPRNRARRIYGSVPFNYQRKRDPKKPFANVCNIHTRGTWFSGTKSHFEGLQLDEKEEETESEGEEEWDRHAALHDDVTGQERLKERLFEEEIELKWEKGGSGLVFYTDAQFWDAKEGDFDAKTADDWDIDTNIYKERVGIDCDKDSRDLLRMRLENSLRSGMETEIDRIHDFAAFEKFSRGFGRKLMESQGWKQGEGIGKNRTGIPEPLPNDGQKPTDKKGFGYRGEKLIREVPRTSRKRRKSLEESFFISTVYDNPAETDPPENAFISPLLFKLKYRKEFLKEHES